MKRSISTGAPGFDTLSKCDLRALADQLGDDVAAVVEQCVAFVESETTRCGHGRVRALMSRRLKHCTVSVGQRERLLNAIMQRLISGRFAEQFKDQLRLALHLDAAHAQAVARSCEYAPAEHVRRYAAWILAHAITA